MSVAGGRELCRRVLVSDRWSLKCDMGGETNSSRVFVDAEGKNSVIHLLGEGDSDTRLFFGEPDLVGVPG